MTVLLYEPKLCSMYELQTLYSVEDFHDFLEIIEVQRAFREENQRQQEIENSKG